jgi:TetR/AcrR family transcriptional regulator, lmrAB and yxaGH operons repressor
MPAALDAKEKAEIINRLFVAFRDRGYEGASLEDLSTATGLGKSSLYHHFPRGKEQMAEVALEQGKAFIQTAVHDVASSSEPLKTKVRRITEAFDQMYAGGRNACMIGKLVVSDVGVAGNGIAREVFAILAEAVTMLAQESGLSKTKAREFGADWVAQVQGALILQAANGDCSPFARAMTQLVNLAK